MSDSPQDLKETVAVVGQATLIKRSDSKYELLDSGSDADRDEILSWAAFHLKDAEVLVKSDHPRKTRRFSATDDPSYRP